MNVRSPSGVFNKDVETTMLASKEARTRSTERSLISLLEDAWKNLTHLPKARSEAGRQTMRSLHIVS